MRAYILDDEELAVRRLARMLESTGRVRIAGSQTDPVEALAEIAGLGPDVLFLDIEMPGLRGFDVLDQLGPDPPLVVFTTAYHEHALAAFRYHSVDYLLKPVESAELDRALGKLSRILGGAEPRIDLKALAAQVAAELRTQEPGFLLRVASKLGDKVEFVDVANVTHFFAQDKLTYAATAGRNYVIEQTIAELERRLDPKQFCRVHRSAIVNLSQVRELHTWFGGKAVLRLKDGRTELQVARERAAEVKIALGG